MKRDVRQLFHQQFLDYHLRQAAENVPKTFALRFVRNEFEAVVGTHIAEDQFVWIPLGINSSNTTPAKGFWAKFNNDSFQLLNETEVLFDTGPTCYEFRSETSPGSKKLWLKC